jgi:hypothetical protein
MPPEQVRGEPSARPATFSRQLRLRNDHGPAGYGRTVSAGGHLVGHFRRSRLRQAAPPELERTLARCLKKNPARFQSA